MEAELNSYVEERFPSGEKRKTSGVFWASFRARIVDVLRNPASGDKNLRFYVNKHKFQLLDLPSLGMKDVLVVPAKGAQVKYFLNKAHQSVHYLMLHAALSHIHTVG